ncbi:MAG: hypothetical protein EOP09_11685, partial [Proteobacteria bacterium]
MDVSEFESLAHLFLEGLFQDLEKAGVLLPSHWRIDHLCYRVDSLARYEIVKTEFVKFGRLLTESPVNGRPIATYKLFN